MTRSRSPVWHLSSLSARAGSLVVHGMIASCSSVQSSGEEVSRQAAVPERVQDTTSRSR
ncbi:hypothetical protein [Streptomyces sp. NPDC002172]